MDMSSPKPAFAFLGDHSGAVAQEVGAQVDLQPLTAMAGPSSAGLLVDGQSASPDAGTLQAVLESGKILALARPTDEHMKTLVALTGQAPAAGTPLVTYRKASNGRGYTCTLAAAGTMTRSYMSQTGEGSTSEPVSLDPAVGSHLVQAAAQVAPLQMSPGLVPPLGAMAGYARWDTPGPWTCIYPWDGPAGPADDVFVSTQNQAGTDSFSTECFVYWVNGGYSPYYILLLRQSGTITSGTVLANNQDSKGWFTSYFDIGPNSLTGSNSQPFGAGFALVGHAPQSMSGPQIPVQLQVAMTLNARGSGGTGPVQWVTDANEPDAVLNYADWAILDGVQGAATSWRGYQTAGWNPLQMPYASFGGPHGWYQELLPSNGVAHRWSTLMTDLALGSIAVTALTAWQFSPPLFTPPSQAPFNPPPSLVVNVSEQWSHPLFLIHGENGCAGDGGVHYVHSWCSQNNWPLNYQIDLGVLAAQQYWGK
jgi:hypothetical protein